MNFNGDTIASPNTTHELSLLIVVKLFVDENGMNRGFKPQRFPIFVEKEKETKKKRVKKVICGLN